jgi:hypothetical protein
MVLGPVHPDAEEALRMLLGEGPEGALSPEKIAEAEEIFNADLAVGENDSEDSDSESDSDSEEEE